MIQVLTQSEVRDFDAFWEVFQTRGHELRKRYGSFRARVFQEEGNPNSIRILYDWESREKFLRCLEDPEVRLLMKEAGLLAPPFFTFLGPAGELDA
jgi:quinol monooxygenase YgiN